MIYTILLDIILIVTTSGAFLVLATVNDLLIEKFYNHLKIGRISKLIGKISNIIFCLIIWCNVINRIIN